MHRLTETEYTNSVTICSNSLMSMLSCIKMSVEHQNDLPCCCQYQHYWLMQRKTHHLRMTCYVLNGHWAEHVTCYVLNGRSM